MIIDEIQPVPDLLTVVHAVLEERLSIRFIMTGPGVCKLRRGGVDLLGSGPLVPDPALVHGRLDRVLL